MWRRKRQKTSRFEKDLRRLGRRGVRRRKKKKWFLLFFVTLFPHILPVFFYLPPPMQFHSFSVVWKEVQKASPNPQDFYNLFFSCPEFVEIYLLRTTGIQCWNLDMLLAKVLKETYSKSLQEMMSDSVLKSCNKLSLSLSHLQRKSIFQSKVLPLRGEMTTGNPPNLHLSVQHYGNDKRLYTWNWGASGQPYGFVHPFTHLFIHWKITMW